MSILTVIGVVMCGITLFFDFKKKEEERIKSEKLVELL
jgi:hypothetical protein